MVIKKHHSGHCEYWLSARHMCSKRGRWMVDGNIVCGEHKNKLVREDDNRRLAQFMRRVFSK